MKNDRELEKMVSRMGLKSGSKQAVVQYARGLQEGMRLAYVAVAKKLASQGSTEEEIRGFLDKLAEEDQLDGIVKEAVG